MGQRNWLVRDSSGTELCAGQVSSEPIVPAVLAALADLFGDVPPQALTAGDLSADPAEFLLDELVLRDETVAGQRVPRFVPMTEEDLADRVRWQNAPHAQPWFAGGPATVEQARQRYGDRFGPASRTRMYVFELAGERIGFVQAYRLDEHDNYAVKSGDLQAIGLDYLIGEPELTDRGIGTAMIWAFLRDVACQAFPDAPRFMASPDHRNLRSLRVLAKCGFRQGLWIDAPAAPGTEPGTEIACTLERRAWFG